MTRSKVVPPARPGGGGRAGNPFIRGLTIGVLVGAAIAGSRIWRRLMRRPGTA